jgi:molybdenum cofactor cytidylyltransferase
MPSVAIVPAAGKGERFGGAKLVALVQGEVLIDRTLRSLIDAGVDRIVVVMAPGAALDGSRTLADPRVRRVVNEDPSRGMFSSIQAGLLFDEGDSILVLPADMPFVSSATVAGVIDACARGRRIVIPVHQGRRGHPVAFPRDLRRAILDAPSDSTLKDALAATGAARFELEVEDGGVLRDVDQREDLGE